MISSSDVKIVPEKETIFDYGANNVKIATTKGKGFGAFVGVMNRYNVG